MNIKNSLVRNRSVWLGDVLGGWLLSAEERGRLVAAVMAVVNNLNYRASHNFLNF